MSKDKKKFYITTPIYYVNDKPHIGHLYTSLICDILARFYRLNDYDVKFLTGTDEHGQKVAKSAELVGKTPKEFCDEVSVSFKELSNTVNLSNDNFIRTTDDYHIKAAQELWNRLIDNNQIYLDKYQGWYSLREETFYAEDELIKDENGNKLSPFGSLVEWVEQESYFFCLSNWQDKLLDFYNNNKDFICPNCYFNEVVSFVKGGLRDISVSRTNFTWGIPIPQNNNHVMYVWIDALTNYLSATGFPGEGYSKYWPADLHVIGKDIIKFHAVYWPAILMAAGIELPKRILTHGWWTVDGQKMSKSLGNVITPEYLVDKYGIDQTRYYLVREFVVGRDGNFCHNSAKKIINSELANSIGNLFQRVNVMVHKNFAGKIPAMSERCHLLDKIVDFSSEYSNLMENYDLYHTLSRIIELFDEANKYINDMAPWSKLDNPEFAGNVLRNCLEIIALLTIYLQPFIPSSSQKILDMLGVEDKDRGLNSISQFRGNNILSTLSLIGQPQIIFPRIID